MTGESTHYHSVREPGEQVGSGQDAKPNGGRFYQDILDLILSFCPIQEVTQLPRK